MIKEIKVGIKQEQVKRYDKNENIIEIIKQELIEYQAEKEKEEEIKEKSLSEVLLESHSFFNELDAVLGTIIADLKKPKKPSYNLNSNR